MTAHTAAEGRMVNHDDLGLAGTATGEEEEGEILGGDAGPSTIFTL
jgi:hypothetical protein